MSVRYEREEEFLASAFKRVGGGLRDVQRATGTERAQTMETAETALEDSQFAKDLAEQLEVELGEANIELGQALADSAAALAEAGLARGEAATAVSDAQAAVLEAEQAILDAAAASGAASVADGKAAAAQTKADQAFADAAAAATAAGNAQTSANGKNRVWYQGTAPAGTGHKTGDTWFDTSNGNRVTQWDGDSWEATQFGTGAIATAAITNALIADATIQSAKIANLDAAKITTGTLDAARIAALAITTGHLAANAVTAEKIAALTITAAEIASNAVTALKIAANAVTAEKINAGAVTTVKLDALAVTAEKIAAGAIIADKIAANAITTAKLAADAIDGMTITGALVRTAESGRRLEMDISGLVAYDASGNIVSRLASSDEGFTVGLPGETRIASLSNGVLSFNTSPTGPLRFSGISAYDVSFDDTARGSRGVHSPETMYVQRFRKQSGLTPDGLDSIEANVTAGFPSLLLEHRNPGSLTTASVWLRAFTDPTDGLTSEIRADVGQFDRGLRVSGSEVSVVGHTHTGAQVSEATEAARGTVERATQAEVNAGTDTTRFVSPKGFRDATYNAFSEAAGVVSTGAGYATVTYPVGRFTQRPILTTSVRSTTGNSVSVPWLETGQSTSSSFKVIIFTIAGSVAAGDIEWSARQMTSTSAQG